MPAALHLVIHGRVQGVFFRDSMRREAEKLGVTGWVCNCNNGTVEAVVQGSPDAVETMIRWARRGPERAHVEKVDISEDSGNYTRFELRPTN